MSPHGAPEGDGESRPEPGGESLPPGRFDRTVVGITRALALVGGVLLLLAVGVTVASVAGRYALSKPIPGDYELVTVFCGIATFLFFPYTHATNGNITAEFFTSSLPPRSQRALDLVHDIIFALAAALLCWRLSIGLGYKFAHGDSTIFLGIPLWWPYSFAVASMALLAVVCLWRIALGIRALRR